MKLRKAQRKQARIKMAIQGPSGSGKTYSALLLAQGLGNLSKTCVIDTENYSADLYAHLGDFSTISLKAPFTPERYITAIDVAEKSGMEIIIIDSLSHCWDYLLEYHGGLSGNTFTNWSKVTPRHRALITRILTSGCHIIATMRVKQDYVLSPNNNGKMVPQKVGLKAVQRDGVDYEFTLVFDLDISHHAVCSKDRTGLFMDKPSFQITYETGKTIIEWCNQGTSIEALKAMISRALTLSDLTELYDEYRAYFPLVEADFKARKRAITNNVLTLKSNENGSH